MKKKNIMKKFKISKSVFQVFFSRIFLLYLLCGGLATIVDWGVYSIGIYIIKINYVYSVTFSFLLGSITNFSLNKYLNFKNKYKKLHYQFLVYLIIAIPGLLLTILLMWMMIDVLLMNLFLSRIITTGVVLIYNYLGHRYLTFNILR